MDDSVLQIDPFLTFLFMHPALLSYHNYLFFSHDLGIQIKETVFTDFANTW